MLELKHVGVDIGTGDRPNRLLHDISVRYPAGHFGAIVGPSGCGKSTLLKSIVGLLETTSGELTARGKNLGETDFEPAELGYIPQFSIAYENLTVRESLWSALKLRVSGISTAEREERLDKILNQIGLAEIADRRNKVLSGGQKRRLAMGLEMATNPAFLFCDEVTSGLDPKSEDEIVHLLHRLSRTDGRIVLSVTHSLRHLDLYDSVTVLYKGRLAYQGASSLLLHYFQAPNAEEIFPCLAAREPEEWAALWEQNRAQYATVSADEPAPEAPPPAPSVRPAGVFTQLGVLLSRRWRLFFREGGQLGLQAALLFIFPAVVTLFALDGIPQTLKENLDPAGTPLEMIERVREAAQIGIQNSKTASLVSGLIMFQVVLLTLMGSNNSAREIVSERLIFEKEKLGGVHPLAYLGSKIAFLSVLVSAQAVWMTCFVSFVCQLFGELPMQIAHLWLVTAAMTSICLAISAWCRTTEQASLISIYLVGFQLPLSGAVLALPDWAGSITRPFISAYWSWSGYLEAMKPTEYYSIIRQITQTPLAEGTFCALVLGIHILLGLAAALLGCVRSQKEL